MGELWGQFGRGSNAAGTTWILQKVMKRTKGGMPGGLIGGAGETERSGGAERQGFESREDGEPRRADAGGRILGTEGTEETGRSRRADARGFLQKETKRTKRGQDGLTGGNRENRAEKPGGARVGRVGPRGTGIGERRPCAGGQRSGWRRAPPLHREAGAARLPGLGLGVLDIAALVDPHVAFGDEEGGLVSVVFFVDGEGAESGDVGGGVVFVDPVVVEVPLGLPHEFLLERGHALGEFGGGGFVAKAVAVKVDAVIDGGDHLGRGLRGLEKPEGEVVVTAPGLQFFFPLIHDAEHRFDVTAKKPAGGITFYEVGKRGDPELVGSPAAVCEVDRVEADVSRFKVFELADQLGPAADFFSVTEGVGHPEGTGEVRDLDAVVDGGAGGGEPRLELGGEVGDDGGVGGEEVTLLGGIGVDVEELDGFAVEGEEFPRAVAHDFGGIGCWFRVVALEAAVEVQLPEYGVTIPRGGGGWIGEVGDEVLSVGSEVGGKGNMGGGANGGEQVGGVAEFGGGGTGGNFVWPASDHGDADAAVVEVGFAAFEIADLALPRGTVIAGEDDEGVIGDTEVFEGGEELADFGIHVLHHGAEAVLVITDAGGGGVGPMGLGRGFVGGVRDEPPEVEEKGAVVGREAFDEVDGVVAVSIGEVFAVVGIGGGDVLIVAEEDGAALAVDGAVGTHFAADGLLLDFGLVEVETVLAGTGLIGEAAAGGIDVKSA